jgi:hypothetical protein
MTRSGFLKSSWNNKKSIEKQRIHLNEGLFDFRLEQVWCTG